MRADRLPILVTVAVGAVLLVRPGAWRTLTSSSSTDALTSDSWQRLNDAGDEFSGRPPSHTP